MDAFFKKFRRAVSVAVAVICVRTGSATAAETNSAVAISNAPSCYKIAVCDWMILKRQKLGAFQLAYEIGADGVEVDMGSLGQRPTFASTLTNAANRQQFLDKARELHLEISSLAMSGFYAQSFAERTNVLQLVQDCLDTMKAMQVRVAFLPLGVKSDLLKHPELRPQVVERLKAVGKLAEAAGVVIGVETELDAEAQVKLFDEVGSPAIKAYYNVANALQHQRDYVQELQRLGKERVVQIHCSNQDGFWLQNDPQIKVPELKAVLDKMDWCGWLVIERSRDTNDVHSVKRNYGANAAYLKSIFQKP
jgi:L-ribulose-5-phosphate 3-epimerase